MIKNGNKFYSSLARLSKLEVIFSEIMYLVLWIERLNLMPASYLKLFLYTSGSGSYRPSYTSPQTNTDGLDPFTGQYAVKTGN